MIKKLGKFAAAAAVYVGFAVYLYQPYFKHFNKLQYLILVNVCLASLGCFVLSRRWVVSFFGSFFAGAVYGFGPFALGMACYHPTAGLLTAAIPWLFLPSAFGPKGRWRWLRVALCALPFVAIVLFFQIAAWFRLFAVPTQSKLYLADLGGLLAPLVMAERSITVVGFYHVPIAAFAMGFLMLLAARRLGVLVILSIGAVLAFCDSVLNISPIIWLALPVLCCSVIIGEGLQGLALAGPADGKWVLATAAAMAALSIAMLLLATRYFQVFAGMGTKYGRLFAETARMYILGTVAVAVIYFMTRAKLRIAALRWVILCSAMAVDIFLGARFIVDKIL
jgi:hypothetical protein